MKAFFKKMTSRKKTKGKHKISMDTVAEEGQAEGEGEHEKLSGTKPIESDGECPSSELSVESVELTDTVVENRKSSSAEKDDEISVSTSVESSIVEDDLGDSEIEQVWLQEKTREFKKLDKEASMPTLPGKSEQWKKDIIFQQAKWEQNRRRLKEIFSKLEDEPVLNKEPIAKNDFTSVKCNGNAWHSRCTWDCAYDFRLNDRGRHAVCKCDKENCTWTKVFEERWCIPAPQAVSLFQI